MLKNRKWLSLAAGAALVALASAPAISINSFSPEQRPGAKVLIITAESAPVTSTETDVRKAAARFVTAMNTRDAEAVWMFASEEEQDAFGTEPDAYAAFVDAFPALANVKSLRFERFWEEGDTPFVDTVVVDSEKQTYRATMGFWLDDAGDWKLVSCDVTPVTDRIAGL